MDKTLLKGLRVLEVLAASPQPMGVTALSRSLDLTRSNTHRTLQTLVSAGYVRTHSASGTYECTLRLFEIASLIVGRLNVREMADAFLQQLSHASHETIHLTVLDGFEIVYINKIESPQPIRAYSAIGGRAPAHCVSSGKALLAWQSDEVLGDIPANLEQKTPQSLASRQALLDDLTETRRRGFATNRGEWRDSVGGVASPVFDANSQPVAAIGMSVPLERFTFSSQQDLGMLVAQSACALSRTLGYRGDAYPESSAA